MQKTLASSASLEGSSLHTGEKVTLTLNPAPTGHGIKFRRVDLDDKPLIEAKVDLVETVDRGVGRIVEHLRASGDLDNTLVLFLSDK